ncbi:hypothetical protein [Cutibacterium avidum]|uniref:hypothetical protein n=1 Tax=Cutibacterium avidum TaxID=33010 RepID=UPI001E56B83C|nr:hypothetical protein [Cutibacterium avidum]
MANRSESSGQQALQLARGRTSTGWVAPQARPPVVKLMDYGKFKYEAAQKPGVATQPGKLIIR